MRRGRLVRLLAGAGIAVAAVVVAAGETGADDGLRLRARVDGGDPLRVQRALAKAERGEPVVVGVIGGSITEGALASAPEHRWASRVAQWWRDRFPQASVEFINAGIGATASDLGAHRVRKALLMRNPDFVVVEYAVNDSGNPHRVETFEGLIRQILAWPTGPGCMVLYTMNERGENTQADHERVARHYGLPAVSFRDALWPEVEAGRIAWGDIEADAVHPNDRGHALCAEFITAYLDELRSNLPTDLPDPAALPAPLTTDAFQHTHMLLSDACVPAASDGWSAGPGHYGAGPGWTADRPGATLDLVFEGTCVSVAYYRVRGSAGQAEVRVDEADPVVLDAYFAEDWGGGYTAFAVVADSLEPGAHRLRIRVLTDKHPDSLGHHFSVDAVCVAGVE